MKQINSVILFLMFFVPNLVFGQELKDELKSYELVFYPETYKSAKENEAFIQNITEAESFVYSDGNYTITIFTKHSLQANVVMGKCQKKGIPLVEVLMIKD